MTTAARAFRRTAAALALSMPGAGAAASAPPQAISQPSARACEVPFASYEVFVESLTLRPADPLDGAPTRMQLAAAYPEAAFQALQAGDGRCLADRGGGHVLRPHPIPGARWPVVVFFRGGLEQRDRLRFGDLVELMALAERGYIVIAPEYASDSESDELGGDENGRLSAWIDGSALPPDAEPEGWLVWGRSRGAINALQLARDRRTVAAVAITSGVLDMRALLDARPELEATLRVGIPDFDVDPEGALADRSPVRWAGELAAPTLLLHGVDDRRVDITQARRFAATRGELREVPDGHGLWAHRGQALDAIDRFFRRHRLPSIPLNHLYVVLDAETYAALRASPFLLEEFAAVDAGLPRFLPVGPDTDVLYIRGSETYLELMAPRTTLANQWAARARLRGRGGGSAAAGVRVAARCRPRALLLQRPRRLRRAAPGAVEADDGTLHPVAGPGPRGRASDRPTRLLAAPGERPDPAARGRVPPHAPRELRRLVRRRAHAVHRRPRRAPPRAAQAGAASPSAVSPPE